MEKSLLHALRPDDSRALLNGSTEVRVAAGEALVLEGEPGDAVYVLLEGSCDVLLGREVVSRVSAGDVVGEIACLEGTARTATLRAREPVVSRRILAPEFRTLLRRSPQLLDGVLRVLSRRARAISERESVATWEHAELKRVQQSLFPDLRQLNNNPEFAIEARWEPLTFASGDYFEALELPSRRFLFAVGDVEGHGAPTALTMGALRGLLRETALDGAAPNALLTHLNEHLARHATGKYVNMTLTIAIFDPATSSFEIAAAGPPLPLVVREGVVSPAVSSNGRTLGYLEGSTYEHSTVAAPSGTRLLMMTDGLTESAASTDRNGSDLGLDGVRRILANVLREPGASVLDRVFAEIAACRGGAPPRTMPPRC